MPARLAICLPVFNAGLDIEGLYACLRAQTCPDWQLLVSNNASTDDTVNRLMSKTSDDPRVTVYSNAENIGMARNFQRAGSLGAESDAPYMAFTMADERLAPKFVERLTACLDSHPTASLVTAAHLQSWPNGTSKRAQFFKSSAYLPRAHYSRLIARTAHLYIGAAVFRRSLFSQLGGFNLTFKYFFDTDFLLRLAATGDAVFVAEVVLSRQMDSANYQRAVITQRALLEELLSRRNFIEDIFAKEPPDTRAEIMQEHRHYAYRLCRRYAAETVGHLAEDYVRLAELVGTGRTPSTHVPGSQPYDLPPWAIALG